LPNKKYVKGRALEYEVMKFLRGRGWNALRTAGSHGWADVIAWKREKPTIFIQCKSFRATPSEMQSYSEKVKGDDNCRAYFFVDVPERGKRRWQILKEKWVEINPDDFFL